MRKSKSAGPGFSVTREELEGKWDRFVLAVGDDVEDVGMDTVRSIIVAADERTGEEELSHSSVAAAGSDDGTSSTEMGGTSGLCPVWEIEVASCAAGASIYSALRRFGWLRACMVAEYSGTT